MHISLLTIISDGFKFINVDNHLDDHRYTSIASFRLTSKEEQLHLYPVIKGRFEQYEVKKDFQLREFVEAELRLEFRRGSAFYEFTHEVENISEDKELIFREKVGCQYRQTNNIISFHHLCCELHAGDR